MKSYFLSFFALAILLTTSCNKDDDCVAGNLETTIVGNWRLTLAGATLGEIEFKANGDFIHDDNILIPEQIAGAPVETKTYSVQSNSLFTLRASNSLSFSDFPLTVTSYDCDEIVTNVQGLEYRFKRE